MDDPLRFAGIPRDAEDLEDTQELPIIRIAEPVAEESTEDDHGRLRRRWARAKAAVARTPAEPEVPMSPEAAEAAVLAQARLSAELS